jgi:hypothetical protein
VLPCVDEHDCYKVELQLGYKAEPSNELELFEALTAVLHGLAALHCAVPPLVHRDVR